MRMRQQLRPVAHPGRRRSQPVCRTEASAGHPRDRPGPGARWHSRAFTSGHPGRDWPDPCRRELPAGPQSASGRDHRGSYAGGQVRGHRLAADCRPVPRAGPLDPSPVIEINRAVAVGMADGLRAGLAILKPVLISGISRPMRRSTPPMLTCLSARVRPTRPLQPGHEPLRQPGTRRSARNYSAAAAKLAASSASPGATHALFREPGQVARSLPGRAEPARVLSLRGLPGARIGAGCWGRSGSWRRSGCPKG